MLGLSEQGKKRLAYGFWNCREDRIGDAIKLVTLARENGIDHFDTADVYGAVSGYGGAERLIGEIRRRAPRLFDGAAIATKAGCEPGTPYNSSPAYLKAACDASLKRMGLQRIDLFIIHRPDFLAHPADVAGALDDLVSAGKVANVGVSNFTVDQVEALARYLKAPIRAHQIEFSAGRVAPLFDGALDQAMKKHIAVTAWSPLARGGLAEGGPAELAEVRETLNGLAVRYGTSPAVAAIAFLHMHPAAVTPILGTTRPERLLDVLQGTIALTRADWYAIVQAARGAPLP
jgi:predicted oxidoreductase